MLPALTHRIRTYRHWARTLDEAADATPLPPALLRAAADISGLTATAAEQRRELAELRTRVQNLEIDRRLERIEHKLDQLIRS